MESWFNPHIYSKQKTCNLSSFLQGFQKVQKLRNESKGTAVQPVSQLEENETEMDSLHVLQMLDQDLENCLENKTDQEKANFFGKSDNCELIDKRETRRSICEKRILQTHGKTCDINEPVQETLKKSLRYCNPSLQCKNTLNSCEVSDNVMKDGNHDMIGCKPKIFKRVHRKRRSKVEDISSNSQNSRARSSNLNLQCNVLMVNESNSLSQMENPLPCSSFKETDTGDASCKEIDTSGSEFVSSAATTLSDKIKSLLLLYPRGIPLEELAAAFERKFHHTLSATEHWSCDLADMVTDLEGVRLYSIENTGCALNDQILMVVLDKDEGADCLTPASPQLSVPEHDNSCPADPFPGPVSSSGSGQHKLPQILLDELHQLLQINDGCITLDLLPAEYRRVTSCSLDVEGLGYSSLHQLLCDLPHQFCLSRHGSQFSLCQTARLKHQTTPAGGVIDGESVLPEPVLRRTLTDAARDRLSALLTTHYPHGLAIDELVGAYRGMFGAVLEDLNPLQYGYLSLDGLLQAHGDLVALQREGDSVWCTNPLLSMADSALVHPCQLQTGAEVVSSSESFFRLVREEVLGPVGGDVEVDLAEIYTPHRFWVMHRGPQTSFALHDLMDRMFELYGSSLGQRYKAVERDLVVGRPVVVLYTDDLNYYRALITAREDVTTYKVFFVDYGTAGKASEASLWLLHREFLALPAQAIAARLAWVVPSTGLACWPRAASRWFLKQVQEKPMLAYIIAYKDTSVEMTLYDTNSSEDVNIADAMVRAAMAQYAPVVPAVEAAARDTTAPPPIAPHHTEALQNGEFVDHMSSYASGVGNPTTAQKGDQSPNTPILDDQGCIHMACGGRNDVGQPNTEELLSSSTRYPVTLMNEEVDTPNNDITGPFANQPPLPCDISEPSGVDQTGHCSTIIEKSATLTDDARDQYSTAESDHVTEALLAMSSLSCGLSDHFRATTPDQQDAMSPTNYPQDFYNRSPSAFERNSSSLPSAVNSSCATAGFTNNPTSADNPNRDPIDGEDTAARARSARRFSPPPVFPPLQTETKEVFYSDDESDYLHFACSAASASLESSRGEHQPLHTHAADSTNVDTHSQSRPSHRWDDPSNETHNNALHSQSLHANCDSSHSGLRERPYSQVSRSVSGQPFIPTAAVTGKPASSSSRVGSGTWANKGSSKGSITRVQLPYGISLVLLKMPDGRFFVPYCQVLALFSRSQDGHRDAPSTPGSPVQPHWTGVLEGLPTTTFCRGQCPELYDMTLSVGILPSGAREEMLLVPLPALPHLMQAHPSTALRKAVKALLKRMEGGCRSEGGSTNGISIDQHCGAEQGSVIGYKSDPQREAGDTAVAKRGSAGSAVVAATETSRVSEGAAVVAAANEASMGSAGAAVVAANEASRGSAGAAVVAATEASRGAADAVVVAATEASRGLAGAAIVTATEASQGLAGAAVVPATEAAQGPKGTAVISTTEVLQRQENAAVVPATEAVLGPQGAAVVPATEASRGSVYAAVVPITEMLQEPENAALVPAAETLRGLKSAAVVPVVETFRGPGDAAVVLVTEASRGPEDAAAVLAAEATRGSEAADVISATDSSQGPDGSAVVPARTPQACCENFTIPANIYFFHPTNSFLSNPAMGSLPNSANVPECNQGITFLPDSTLPDDVLALTINVSSDAITSADAPTPANSLHDDTQSSSTHAPASSFVTALISEPLSCSLPAGILAPFPGSLPNFKDTSEPLLPANTVLQTPPNEALQFFLDKTTDENGSIPATAINSPYRAGVLSVTTVGCVSNVTNGATDVSSHVSPTNSTNVLTCTAVFCANTSVSPTYSPQRSLCNYLNSPTYSRPGSSSNCSLSPLYTPLGYPSTIPVSPTRVFPECSSSLSVSPSYIPSGSLGDCSVSPAYTPSTRPIECTIVLSTTRSPDCPSNRSVSPPYTPPQRPIDCTIVPSTTRSPDYLSYRSVSPLFIPPGCPSNISASLTLSPSISLVSLIHSFPDCPTRTSVSPINSPTWLPNNTSISPTSSLPDCRSLSPFSVPNSHRSCSIDSNCSAACVPVQLINTSPSPDIDLSKRSTKLTLSSANDSNMLTGSTVAMLVTCAPISTSNNLVSTLSTPVYYTCPTRSCDDVRSDFSFSMSEGRLNRSLQELYQFHPQSCSCPDLGNLVVGDTCTIPEKNRHNSSFETSSTLSDVGNCTLGVERRLRYSSECLVNSSEDHFLHQLWSGSLDGKHGYATVQTKSTKPVLTSTKTELSSSILAGPSGDASSRTYPSGSASRITQIVDATMMEGTLVDMKLDPPRASELTRTDAVAESDDIVDTTQFQVGCYQEEVGRASAMGHNLGGDGDSARNELRDSDSVHCTRRGMRLGDSAPSEQRNSDAVHSKQREILNKAMKGMIDRRRNVESFQPSWVSATEIKDGSFRLVSDLLGATQPKPDQKETESVDCRVDRTMIQKIVENIEKQCTIRQQEKDARCGVQHDCMKFYKKSTAASHIVSPGDQRQSATVDASTKKTSRDRKICEGKRRKSKGKPSKIESVEKNSESGAALLETGQNTQKLDHVGASAAITDRPCSVTHKDKALIPSNGPGTTLSSSFKSNRSLNPLKVVASEEPIMGACSNSIDRGHLSRSMQPGDQISDESLLWALDPDSVPLLEMPKPLEVWDLERCLVTRQLAAQQKVKENVQVLPEITVERAEVHELAVEPMAVQGEEHVTRSHGRYHEGVYLYSNNAASVVGPVVPKDAPVVLRSSPSGVASVMRTKVPSWHEYPSPQHHLMPPYPQYHPSHTPPSPPYPQQYPPNSQYSPSYPQYGPPYPIRLMSPFRPMLSLFQHEVLVQQRLHQLYYNLQRNYAFQHQQNPYYYPNYDEY